MSSPSSSPRNLKNRGSATFFNQGRPELHPQLPLTELQDLILWGSRGKDLDGLDHGYWEPWGPPCDLQHLDSQESLSTLTTWLVKQLRSHRDATAQLASRLQKFQRSLFDEDAGKVTFEAAVALIAEVPQRLKALEDSTQNLQLRVNQQNEQQLKRAATRVSLPPVKAAKELEIHDKPVEQAVKECREAVNLMLELQRKFTDEQDELLRSKLLHFEEEFHKAGVANADEIAFRYSTRDREMEGVYARLEGVEHVLQRGEDTFGALEKWKDKHSLAIFELERRTAEAESQLKLVTADLEDHAQELLALVEMTKEEKAGAADGENGARQLLEPCRTLSKARAEEAKAVAATAAKEEADAKEIADAKAAAEKAMTLAEEMQKEVNRIYQELQYARSVPRDAWPHRNAPLVGRLPNLPPSSLAQEETDGIRPQDPQIVDLKDVDFPVQKVQVIKERFIPPTGGCFREGTTHRYRERRKRPSTAVYGVPMHSKGDAGNRPSTAR